MEARLRTYREQTAPIIELFERKEFVAKVDASQEAAKVFADVCGALGLGARE